MGQQQTYHKSGLTYEQARQHGLDDGLPWMIGPRQVEEFRESFNIFDVDGSGEISVEELGDLMRAFGQVLCPPLLYSSVEDGESVATAETRRSGETLGS